MAWSGVLVRYAKVDLLREGGAASMSFSFTEFASFELVRAMKFYDSHVRRPEETSDTTKMLCTHAEEQNVIII